MSFLRKIIVKIEKKSCKGFIALTSTIIISALILLLIVGALTVSVIEMEKGGARYNFEKSRSWANSCAEIALQEVRDDSNYTAENVTFGAPGEQDGCFYDVSGDFPEKTVESTGLFSDHTQRVRVVISDNDPTPVIDSWEEVSSF